MLLTLVELRRFVIQMGVRGREVFYSIDHTPLGHDTNEILKANQLWQILRRPVLDYYKDSYKLLDRFIL